ncbi:MAG: saccharopine dehydrogenase family protein [Alphaproteobacteria bacterium]
MTRIPRDQKPLDVVLVGATGYVGQLIAEHLASKHRGEVRWAMAGRSRAKLDALAASLGAGAAGVETIVADTSDEAADEDLGARASVVLTTVGPYAKYGSQLLGACARAGTDYCDLTGETPWIQRMIDTWQAAAEASGARIVPCCGFDSIPSDLGVFFLNEEVRARTGAPCRSIRMRVVSARGGVSGGTVASMLHMIETMNEDPRVRETLRNPFALNPAGARTGPRQPGGFPISYDREVGCWTAPFVMAAINTRVVHRSNALLGQAYGADFAYEEALRTGGPLLGAPVALAVAGGMGAFGLATLLPPARALLARFVLPKPGEGPTPEVRERGSFDLLFVGKGADGKTYRARVKGDRDPGYGSTAKMIAESAICLTGLPPGEPGGGLWTPASAMGHFLIERLRAHAGLTFGMES